MRHLLCAIVVALAVVIAPTGRAAGPTTAPHTLTAAIVSDKVTRATPLPDLLQAALHATPGIRWVERDEVDRVLGEQQLANLFAADQAGGRVALGQLLKADVIVALRTDQAAGGAVVPLEVVVCESGSGLRLATAESKAAPTVAAEALAPLVASAIARAAEPVRQIVAVPPFTDDDLTRDFDPMKAAYAKLVEASLRDRPGVRVVELAEAQAIGREVAIAGEPVRRPTPLYVLGNFRDEGLGEARRVSIGIRFEVAGRSVATERLDSLSPAVAGARLTAAVTTRMDALAGATASIAASPPDAHREARQLFDRASTFARLGDATEAIDLLEAALALWPDEPTFNRDLFLLLDARARRHFPPPAKSKTTLATLAPVFEDFRRAMNHWEVYARQSEIIFDPKGRVVHSTWLLLNDEHPPRIFSPETADALARVRAEGQATVRRVLEAKAAAHVDDDTMLVYAEWALPKRPSVPLTQAERVAEYADRVSWGKKFEYLSRAPRLLSVLLAPTIPLFDSQASTQSYFPNRTEPERVSALTAFADSPYEPVRAFAQRELRLVDRLNDRAATRPAGARAAGPTEPASVAGPQVTFERVPLTMEDAKGHTLPATHPGLDLRSWRCFQGNVDLVEDARSRLWMMSTEGHLRCLTDAEHHVMNGSAAYDGRYLWLPAAVASSAFGKPTPRVSQTLTVLEPGTGGSWVITAADGLPPFSELKVGVIEQGRVCVAGSFGNDAIEGCRSWCAVLKIDPLSHAVNCDVFHEARNAPDADPAKVREDLHTAFWIRYVYVLTAPSARPDLPIVRRALIGRGSPNNRAHLPPLICDPDAPKVLGTMNDPVYRPGGAVGDLDISSGAVDGPDLYWMQIDGSVHGKFKRAIYRATLGSQDWVPVVQGIPHDATSTPPYLLEPAGVGRMRLIGRRWCYDLDLKAGTARPLAIGAVPPSPDPVAPTVGRGYALGRSSFYGPLLISDVDDVYRIKVMVPP